MFWVVLCAILAYIVVNVPLIYSLFFVQGRQGIATLWGYAPNQFLFLVLAFPFAALSTFIALHNLIVNVGPEIPPGYPVRVLFDNWIASFLIGLIVVSLIAIGVYFSSAMSFDKLQPKYAQRAVEALKLLEDRIEDIENEKREPFRQSLIRQARKELEALAPPPSDDATAFETWIDQLPPDVYLQVVQNPKFERPLMNPTIQSLNIVQLTTALFVGFYALVAIIFCIYASRGVSLTSQGRLELSGSISVLYYALFFFALYPICYSQHRAEIERFAGTGSSVLQDVLTGLAILTALILLRASDVAIREAPGFNILNYVPIIIVVVGYVVQISNPQIMRQLIGSQTRFGTQIIFAIVYALLSVFGMVQIWPRN